MKGERVVAIDWDAALDIVCEADRFMERDGGRIEARQSTVSRLQALLPSLEEITKEKDSGELARLGALLKILKEYTESEPPAWGGVRIRKGFAEKLQKRREEIERLHVAAVCRRAEALRDYALDRKSPLTHTQRQRLLERAIRMVTGLFRDEDEAGGDWPANDHFDRDQACCFIARCYLQRGLMIFPRGMHLPPKKVEAFLKAVEWTEKCDKTSTERHRTVLQIAPHGDPYEVVRKAVEEAGLLEAVVALSEDEWSPKSVEDWEVAEHILRNGMADDRLIESLKQFVQRKVSARSNPRVCLLQARAASDLGERKAMIKALEELVPRLAATPFSLPLWDDAVHLLMTLKPEERGNLALQCFESCLIQEERTVLPVKLRWYWARLRDLYALAFSDARKSGKLLDAVRVADSLKSRPTIREHAFSETLSNSDADYSDLLEKGLEVAVDAHLGLYSRGVSEHEEAVRDLSSDLGAMVVKAKARDYEDLPEGCAAVHFFMDMDGRDGWALIIRKGEEIERRPEYFNAARLWEKYQGWERTYRTSPASESLWEDACDKRLQELCDAMGEELAFLFDVEASTLNFIPFGFLHLTPLHATRRNGKFLFEEKASTYLPAWSLAPKGPLGVARGMKGLFMNWEGLELKELADEWRGAKADAASPGDVIRYLEGIEQPRLVAFFCHGEANIQNPYLSGLKLRGGLLTHMELQKHASCMNLEGSRVVLGACETDLGPARASAVDEHLSVASFFLGQKVSSVAGSLWVVRSDLQAELTWKIKAGPQEPHLCVQSCQKRWISQNERLFHVAPFRVLGLPGPQKEEVKHV